MVAKIVIGKSIRGILHYNENKVAEGKAQLIMASGFAGEVEHMSFDNKLKRFENLLMLKEKVKTNAMHISLNFHSSEQLDNGVMQAIAASYMEKIGFGDQPFLVYRHMDAAHSHVHIATVNIQPDGQRIDINKIGMLKSEPARKQIEQDFALVRAESKTFKTQAAIKPADLEKAQYGRISTKRAISNVIGAVTGQYKFTSLAELNAVLKQFNVIADRGNEDTVMFQKKGLIYSLLDNKGNKIGVPIKASAFYSKPTLKKLEDLFVKNEDKRKPFKENLKTSIDAVFKKHHSITRNTFVAELQKRNIVALFRQNEQGFIYGVTFVDHYNKTVFNGSEIGKLYSAKALTERFSTKDDPIHKTYITPKEGTSYLKPTEPSAHLQPSAFDKMIDALMGKQPADIAPLTPKKKKRRQGRSL